MVIDRGYSIENYVGTYRLIEDKEVDATLIVSEEVNFAEDGEKELKKQQIFEYDIANDEHIFLQLAHVDIDSDEAILEYCNKYGLPYSSQIAFDEESGVGKDINKDVARYINKRVNALYKRNDTMDRLEFCRLAVQIRKMLELKALLDRERERDKKIPKRQEAENKALCSELIPLLTYLVFYSRAFVYDYDDFDEEIELVSTRIMRLQYYFQSCFANVPDTVQKLNPAVKISIFLILCQTWAQNPDTIRHHQVISDLASEEDVRVLEAFNHIFKSGEKLLYGPEIPVTSDDREYLNQIFAKITSTQNQFKIDKYGRIEFFEEIEYDGNVEELKKLGYIVLRNLINEGIWKVTPQLALNNNSFHGDWKLRHQMEGIYMEFFTELAQDSQYRLCANTTCGKFFSASRSRPNKIYCCPECGVLQAKRNERARKKISPSET